MKISRPPPPITRAAARAPRNAPVRLTSRTCRHTAASVWRGPATTGEIPALQIHTSTPPHSATAASATASLKSSSVTSPLSTRDGPGSRAATAFRSLSVRATSATEAPALREGVGEQGSEASAGAGDHHPLARDRAGVREGVGDLDLVGASLCSRCTDQYNTPSMTVGALLARLRSPTVDLVEMYRRMLVIRGFEERVSALYRDGEVPGFVHLSIGQEATAVGACWPLGPADVITSTHRGHGHCLAKGLDPVGMFAELMGKDQGTNRGRGGSMHIADPKLGIFGANGIVAAGLPIAVGRGDGRAAPRGRQRGGGVLRRRRAGAGRVPRGHEPRRRVAGCRSSSSARTTATPSSRRPPPSMRRRSSSGPPATAIPYRRRRRQRRGGDRRRHRRRGQRRPRRWRPDRRRGRDLPLARPLRR